MKYYCIGIKGTGMSTLAQILRDLGNEVIGYDDATGKMLICVNPAWFRPTDVDNLWGDPTKARKVLGWNPQKTSYEELVSIMAKHDRELARREAIIKGSR